MRRVVVGGVLASGAAACALVAGLSDDYVGAADAGAPDGNASDGGAPDTATVRDGSAPDARPVDAGPPRSCADILARDPSLRGMDGGFYSIDPDGTGGRPPLLVYCEMAVDDGGWTLVGRSSPPAQLPFGWSSTAGDVTNTGPPYSLGVMGSGLPFHEVLLADRASFQYEPDEHAYKLSLPPDFVKNFADAASVTAEVTTILGGCRPDGGPSMMRFVGWTGLDDLFFVRDFPDLGQKNGLKSDYFDLAYTDCDHGGELSGKLGLIYVR